VCFGIASPARADVHVQRSEDAPSCPDAAWVAERLAAESVSSDAEITVLFERIEGGHRAVVRSGDGRARTLTDDSADCAGLAEAAYLSVKLALETDPSPPARTVAVPNGTREEPSRVARPSLPVAEASLAGVMAVGLGRRATPGMRASASLLLGASRWSLGITGAVFPSQTSEVAGGTLSTSLAGGGIEGCRRASLGSLGLALCSRFEAMRLVGSAAGFDRSESHARPLFVGSILGRAQHKLGPIAAFVEVAAVAPVVRERFAIDTIGVVYESPIVAGAGGIGVALDFE
jgi:hypothetical protein